MDRKDLIAQLCRVGLCRDLAQDELDTLCEAGRLREAEPQQELVVEGETSDTLYILLDGEVAVVKRDAQGEEAELAVLGRGAILGEVALLHSVPRTATVRATGPVRSFALDRQSFDRLLSENEPAALKLGLAIARSLALRLNHANERLMDLLHRPTGRDLPELDQFRDRLLRDWDF